MHFSSLTLCKRNVMHVSGLKIKWFNTQKVPQSSVLFHWLFPFGTIASCLFASGSYMPLLPQLKRAWAIQQRFFQILAFQSTLLPQWSVGPALVTFPMCLYHITHRTLLTKGKLVPRSPYKEGGRTTVAGSWDCICLDSIQVIASPPYWSLLSKTDSNPLVFTEASVVEAVPESISSSKCTVLAGTGSENSTAKEDSVIRKQDQTSASSFSALG